MIIIYRILDHRHHALPHNHSDTDFQTIYINADSVTDLSESLECNQTMLDLSWCYGLQNADSVKDLGVYQQCTVVF